MAFGFVAGAIAGAWIYRCGLRGVNPLGMPDREPKTNHKPMQFRVRP